MTAAHQPGHMVADTTMNHDLDLLLKWLDSDGRRLWAEAVRRLRVELDEAKRARGHDPPMLFVDGKPYEPPRAC